jgi:hypothetical protein
MCGQGQEEQELAMLVDYNFQLVRSQSDFYGGCVNDTQLAQRLWNTFQFNGYIPSTVQFQVWIKIDISC